MQAPAATGCARALTVALVHDAVLRDPLDVLHCGDLYSSVLSAPLYLNSRLDDGSASEVGLQWTVCPHELHQFSCDRFICFGGALDLYGKEHRDLRALVGHAKASLDAGRVQRSAHPGFDLMLLRFDALAIALEDAGNNIDECLGDSIRVGVGCEPGDEFVPCILGAGKLLVKRCAGLEEHGVGEDSDAACGVQLSAGAHEFHHVKTRDAD